VSRFSRQLTEAALPDAELPSEAIEIQRTIDLLGGRKVAPRPICTRLEAHDLLQKGLPSHTLDRLMKEVRLLTAAAWTLEKAVGISVRTHQRHIAAPGRRLSPEQSGRTWKFAEVLGRATALLGSQDEAEAWLDRPAMALDQRKPIDLLSTPAGVETVEQHLTRLEYGVYT
jgi:putative toxin-antitoxin system antitoxin component (TIGR02293 family)